MEENWYCSPDGKTQVGPIARSAIVVRIQNGELTGESLVWNPSTANWMPLKEIDELAVFLRPPPLPVAPVTNATAHVGHFVTTIDGAKILRSKHRESDRKSVV